jgi:hypothetical protein
VIVDEYRIFLGDSPLILPYHSYYTIVQQGQESLQTIEVIVKTVAYMEKQSTELAAACRNQEDRCAFWVAAGEGEESKHI